MCGRYTIKTDSNQLEKEFGVVSIDEAVIRPRFNVAPTQTVPVVVELDGQRVVNGFRWGLIPSWAKEASIGSKMINARSETIAEKPSFRNAFKRRRCIVPANGFYEWQKTATGPKQPYLFFPREREMFAFAGLWEEWLDKDSGELVETCTIITTSANETMAPFHDRMPVILENKDFAQWLDGNDQDTVSLQELLKPCGPDVIGFYPVSRAVNSPSNDSEELIVRQT
jgi:putative SOS response-associated peptidase YedK